MFIRFNLIYPDMLSRVSDLSELSCIDVENEWISLGIAILDIGTE